MLCSKCGKTFESGHCDGDIAVCSACDIGDKQYQKGYNAAIKRARIEIEHLYSGKYLVTHFVIDELLLNMLISKPKHWRAK